jgi:signal transduction histidine kinase
MALLWTALQLSAADESNVQPAISETVITNLAQFWAIPQGKKSQLHRLQAEFLIYYCDSNWNVFWGRSGDKSFFLPLRGLPLPLKSGDKIFVNGLILPVNQEFLWDKTAIQVLSESNEIESVSTRGKLLDTASFSRRFVEVEALVDSQRLVSSNVLRLDLLAENFNLNAFVHLDQPGDSPPDFTGKFVRLKGVYSETIDARGMVANITLWTPGLSQVETTGALAEDSRFSIPTTSSESFTAIASKTLVHVRGTVRSQQPGEMVTIWDDAGQIRIFARQRHPLQRGDRIEAIGQPAFQGIDRVLQEGLFRLELKNETNAQGLASGRTRLRLADQVRGLDQDQIVQQPAISLEGVVTWVDLQRNFIFVLDSSGGIRVMQSKLQTGRRIQAGMLVKVDGRAATGDFAPVITNAVVRQTGTMDLPDAPLTSLEQALTGTEDGRWIQMRGYVRKVVEADRALELQLVAPGGEFTARVPRDNALRTLQGSVILVRGVCVVAANSRRQLTGVEIWSAGVGDVQTEQSAPEDLFALPLRSVASLRQFNLFNTLNERVRTRGSVTLHIPRRYLYVQDGDSSILALSDQTEPLNPGDRVEVVGFSGNNGGNFLLREATYRRIEPGPQPVPVQLPALQFVNEGLDGLLVRAEGLLLDIVEKAGETRLIFQVKDLVFEAKLDKIMPFTGGKPGLGSKLAITGVYRIQRDEYGKPRSFLLNLRDGGDVRVLEPPPWWTLPRLLLVLAGVLLVFLLALFWALEARHKNNFLLHAQAQLKAAHDKLEERVQERTRELREQIEARKRAHSRLSEAQQRLIHASRQAGMAEVATGILHNVGNVLNSVNVSASMIGGSVERLRIGNFSKAVALMNESGENLAGFLTEDPRGRALPGYLRDLAAAMEENQLNLQNEVKSLIKQIDHVKAIVALQQGYARSSSFKEELDPVELMDDAVQINRAALERHGIEVVRQYENPPLVFADRHKVLQIFINLLSNAKYALKEQPAPDKRLVLRIRGEGGGRVRFEISDTGMGIAPENLERIFTLGFTTKTDGHGFGLHSGANAAKEMGGRLYAFSEGAGRGATFILELPEAVKAHSETKVEAEST